MTPPRHTPPRTPRPRRRRAHPALGVAGLCAVALLTSCTTFGSAGDDDTLAAATAQAADLQQQFEQLPGVTSATVEFQDDLTVQAQLEASVTVSSVAEVDPTFQAIEQASWLSDIDPLKRLTLSVLPAGDPTAGHAEDYNLTEDTTVTQLTDRWGERP